MHRQLVLGCLVVALFGSACGSTDAQSDEVVSAAGSTEAAGTARVESTTRMVGEAVAPDGSRTGFIDFARRRSETIDHQTKCRTITVGDVSYIELPLMDGAASGKRWLRSDAAETERLFEQSREPAEEDELGVSSSILIFSSEEVSPDSYFDYLRSVSGEPERLGTEEIRGMATTRFRVEIDQESALRHDLTEAGWKPENVQRYLEGLVGGVTGVDVWVSADGLVRRVVRTDAFPGPDASPDDAYVTTTDFFDFGVVSNIQAPPATDVVDWDEWQRATEREMSDWLEEHRDMGNGELESGPFGSGPTTC